MYEYGNARVRAMKGRLLSRRELEGLLERHDVEQIIAALAQTDYGPDVAAALVKRSGVECVEEALRLNLARTTRTILGFYEGQARELVALLVERYDVYNVLTVLRGKAGRASPDEIVQALLPGGQLEEAALTELAKRDDVRQVIDLLATWRSPYARPLTAALRDYEQDGDPATLEVALVQDYYRRAVDRLELLGGKDAALVRQVLEDEIDARNVTTVLRLCQRRQRLEPQELRRQLIERGARLKVGELVSLCALGQVDQALASLGKTPLGAALRDLPDGHGAGGQVSSAQLALERRLLARSARYSHGDPLGIGVVVAYLAAKEAELVNLRLIARGRWLGMDKQEIADRFLAPAA